MLNVIVDKINFIQYPTLIVPFVVAMTTANTINDAVTVIIVPAIVMLILLFLTMPILLTIG